MRHRKFASALGTQSQMPRARHALMANNAAFSKLLVLDLMTSPVVKDDALYGGC